MRVDDDRAVVSPVGAGGEPETESSGPPLPCPAPDTASLVRLLLSAVELVGESDALHSDVEFGGVLWLAGRALVGFTPDGDMEAGIAALEELAAVSARLAGDTSTDPA